MAKFTKQAIVSGFLQILRTKSFDKITIKDICELCEINRNTFYYHYSDIYQVLDELFSDQDEPSKNGDSRFGSFYDELIYKYELIMNNKKVVYHVYDSKSRDIVESYLMGSISKIVDKYVRMSDTLDQLSEEDREYINMFYTSAVVGITVGWLREGLPDRGDELIYRISQSYETTIQDMISSCTDINKNPEVSNF